MFCPPLKYLFKKQQQQPKPQAVEAWLHLLGFFHAVLGRRAAKAFADAKTYFWDFSLRETSASQRSGLNSCSLSWQVCFLYSELQNNLFAKVILSCENQMLQYMPLQVLDISWKRQRWLKNGDTLWKKITLFLPKIQKFYFKREKK